MSDRNSPFHRGEQALQARLGVREEMAERGRRLIRDHMPEQHRRFFSQLPLFLIGAADAGGRPWASPLAGRPGFLTAVDDRTLEVRARPVPGDPAGEALVAGAEIGGLGIEFHSRRRNRVNGTIAKGGAGGFRIRVAQSFGNCPRYIQAREVVGSEEVDAEVRPRPVRPGPALGPAGAALVARSDTFFIASRFTDGGEDAAGGVDVSHRGGRPGFVQVAHEGLLRFPDYPGNSMFNTLGNILVEPRCGLLFIDFETGDTLQLTGAAEILWASPHRRRFPGAERVVAFRIEATRFIERALPLSWRFLGYSPVLDRLEAAAAGPSRREAGADAAGRGADPRGDEPGGREAAVPPDPRRRVKAGGTS